MKALTLTHNIKINPFERRKGGYEDGRYGYSGKEADRDNGYNSP